ncbi:Methylated-DNA--protein-cysteine methyltransferase, constitutive [BD1-7 clade bacterium]|uniref:Methylated-DNA--protein-cysteine methyltransferase n=1 Tax=BD1-7 clade bacterium TaxID=2029982 RepID=A0A5S9PIN1_9GAMM|nr:Methylated-DNA--protein-cysteine methyltransferase, constitutive [BD1-7 clade bacterium]CAA0103737.1 Methylated-DNA--protein-cysteine methyltransferase, constitutive [BD1-7 clade bacterium]
MFYTKFETTLCPMILVGDEDGIQQLYLCDVQGSHRDFEIAEGWQRVPEAFAEARHQIQQYLAGERQTFDLVLNPKGTEFQRSVWRALCDIPYGDTCSYKNIAEALASPKACRAVGAANGKNPIPLIVPCHRVVGSNGSLTGFAFGVELKRQLLALESSGPAQGDLI